MLKADKKPTSNRNKLATQTSLQLLPLIMDNIPQAVFWKDQNLVYLGCNRAFAESAGFASPEEIIGKTDFDMPWKAQAEQYRANDRHVLDSGEPKLNYEEAQVTSDGSTIWLRTSKIPVCENGRVVAILGMDEDITEHKQAELDLLLRDRALASSINAVIILDLLSSKPIYANESLLKMTGYTFEEIEQLSLADITGSVVELPKIRAAVEEQGFFAGEERIRRKDGSSFPATFFTSLIRDTKGQPIAVQSSFFDISERKQAETLQQQSEYLFRALFEMSPDAVMLLDPYDPSGEWPIVDCNTAACAINGYRREELIGQPVNIVNAPTDHPIDRSDYLKQLHESGSVKYEIVHYRKDGTTFPVETSTTLIKIGERELLLGIDRDITDRKRAEMDILLRDRALASSLNAVLVAGLDFKPIYVNESFLKMTGYTYEEAMQLMVTDLTGDPEGLKQIDEATHSQGFFIGEEPIKRKDGSIFPTDFSTSYITDVNNKPIAIQTTFIDITERKQVEAAIRDNEEKLRAIYEGTSDAIMLLNEKGFFDCNSQTLKMFGFKTKEEFITVHPSDVSPASQPDGQDSLSTSQEHIQTAYRQGYDRFDWIHRRSNGENFPAEVLLSAFDFGGQRILQATVRDITKRKQAEQALRKNQQFLQTVMDNIPQSIFWKDSNLTYLGCNSAFAADAGLASPSDILGKNDWAMPWKEQAESYRADDSLVMKNGTPKLNYEEPQTTPEGRTTWLRTSKIPLYDETGKVYAVLGMYEDITERKQGEEALSESEARFRSLFEQSADAILLIEDGIFTDCNPATMGLMRATNKDEFLSLHPSKLSPEYQPDGRLSSEKADDMMRIALEKGSNRFEWIHRRVDGTDFPVEVLLTAISTGDRQIIHTVWRDISERKQSEAQLQQEKFLSDAIINGMPGVFYLFDTQGRMVRWNKQYERVLGFTPEEAASISALDVFAAEDKERVAAAVQRVFVEGQDTVDANFVTKNGRYIPYYLTGQRLEIDNQVYLVGTGIDMTERKQAEQALRENQQFLQTVMDNIPQSIFWKDNDLTYLGCNSAFAADAGLASPSDILGKNDWAMPWKEQAESYRADDSLVMKNGIPKLNYEEPQTTPEGRTTWLRTSKIPLYDETGKVYAVLGMYEDITERKQLENQIREAFERRGLQVQLSTQVSQSIASAASLAELYERVVTQVKEQFGYYHTQLLRYDPAQEAVVLVTGYGETGSKMLAAGHHLPMGEGLIGTAAASGETVLRPTLESDPDWHPNPLLPETKGEIAVPIKLGNEVLGVLDVQSNVAGALSADDQLLLEGLCGQIATAIEDTRLRQEMTERAERDILFRDRALDSSINAIFISDLNSKVVYVNDAFLKLSGYTREEALQLSPTALTNDPTTLQRVRAAIVSQGFYVGEDIFKRKDGSLFPVDYSASSIHDAEGRPVATQASFVDITERKQSEAQLQQEKSFSDATINGLPGIFFLFDTQGKMIRWNKQYEQVLEHTTEEVAKLNALDSIADEDKEKTAATIQQAFVEGQGTVEAHVITRSGQRIPYYFVGQRIQLGDQSYIAGTGIDITERKQAEEAVRSSREELLNIIDFLPDATLVTDKDRKVIAWNRAIEEMTGIKKEEILGKGDYAYSVPFYGEARPMLVDFAMEHTQVADRYTDLQQHGDQLSAEVYVSSVYQGRGGYLLAIASPLYDADGNIIGAIEAIRDVTERKQLENQIREAFERRGLQVQLSTQVSQSIASAASLAELYERVVTQVKEQFGYYHTQLLRYDPAQEAVVLVTGYGETGSKMLAAGHHLPMGEGLIGTAAASGETVLRPTLESDPDWHPNPLLPETKGEIAVPIKLGNEVLGVLDVQSNVAGALSADDQLLLEGLCGQIATAIEDTRLRQEMAERLEEVNRLYRAMSHEGWQTYREKAHLPAGFVYDQAGLRQIEDAGLTQELFADIPLTVPGGETVGKLAIANDPQHPLSPDDEAFLQQVSEQLALALESARLFEQTQAALSEVQRRASELETVAKVSATTSTVLDPDQLLQTVVDLTKERFDLYHAHIYVYEESWNTLLLAAGAGEVGRKLVAEEHAIPLSIEQSLVARAARDRKAIIANDVNKEPGFLPNPLLPQTRAEMAIPMTVGDKLLGIFDVQSNKEAGFSDEDASVYVTLASQVGVALQNARLYMEQAALVTQLRELDRLKSSFLANMSHELRTPLNSILGFADVIIEELDGPLTENMSNDLRLIQKNGQHLLHLINDVLDMAKIEAGRMNLNPENFKAFEVLEEVTSITSTLASEKNLALFIREDSDQEVKIYADRTRLRQVMINLVNNAIKFTETGNISLKLDTLQGARILITVKDTGIGIPPDKLEAVFQEFTQVDSSSTRKAGGTGLGLPISRKLVEMHGGRLWAESNGIPGEGSTFFVELPIEARITETIEKQAK